MWAKVAAAFVTPILAVSLVVLVLVTTHHTVFPTLVLPDVPPAAKFAASGASPKAIPPGPCLGKHRKHSRVSRIRKHIARNTATFQQVTGKQPQIVEFYNPFLNPFAQGEAAEVINSGEIPLIQLNPFDVTVRDIADGVYDPQLHAFADAVRQFACAIILSFGHEMNGWWYPWGEPWTTPKEFIAAWRHIHDIFKKVGVGNVTWSWDPSHQYQEVAIGKVASPASEWYPGNKYVNIIGLDGYLGYDKNGSPQNFREIFGFQLHDIRRIAPHMPVYLAETGVSPGPAATSADQGALRRSRVLSPGRACLVRRRRTARRHRG